MSHGNICDLLGSRFPIIQAPMAGVQDSALAIAVCEAGGLGSLPCGMLSIEQMVNEIKVIKSATANRFNLNFFCHQMQPYAEKQHRVWQECLELYAQELGVKFELSPGTASRVPFNHDIADALEPFKPEVLSFHFGLPNDALLARIKSWGAKILSSATTVNEALWLASKGVDAIIAQGLEAGGHRGMFLSDDLSTQMGMSALVPQIANSVAVPVIAAGGIADSRGVQAALQLGASAVQVGTAYLLCTEAKTSRLHRLAIKSNRAEHTAVTNLFSGKPARGIVNRVMKDLGYMNALAPVFPYASIEMTQLRVYAERQGIDDFSPLWCGQNVLGCKEISAKELTLMLCHQASGIFKSAF